MSNLTPFVFNGSSIRVVIDESGEPLFVGKDICDALGYVDTSSALKQHCKGAVKRHPLKTSGGIQELRVLSEPDVLRLIVKSTLPASEEFERLVFEEILPSIRKTGSYSKTQEDKKPSAIEPAKEFKALFSIGRMLGLDKNAAAISANQGTIKLTGTNVLGLLGQTHLVAENQESLWSTVTELGKTLSISGMKMNKLLESVGLQEKLSGHWQPTSKAEGLYRLFDTGKSRSKGTPVQAVKWSKSVLEIINGG